MSPIRSSGRRNPKQRLHRFNGYEHDNLLFVQATLIVMTGFAQHPLFRFCSRHCGCQRVSPQRVTILSIGPFPELPCLLSRFLSVLSSHFVRKNPLQMIGTEPFHACYCQGRRQILLVDSLAAMHPTILIPHATYKNVYRRLARSPPRSEQTEWWVLAEQCVEDQRCGVFRKRVH